MELNTGPAVSRQRGVADSSGASGSSRVDDVRPWLWVAGAALVIVSLVPPVATLSQRYLFVESLQFSALAMICPALIVLGAPWRLLRLPGGGDGSRPGIEGPQPASSGDRQPSLLRGAVFLAAFILVTMAWRLPPALDAVARLPGLVAAEAVTLLAVGVGLWLQLVQSPPLARRLPSPQRAAIAALAMWSTWIVAYALGFSIDPVVSGYAGDIGLGTVADQEIAVGLVWGVAAVCFVPVIFAALFSWLTEGRDAEGGDTGGEFRQAGPGAGARAGVKGWDRPPRRRGGSSG